VVKSRYLVQERYKIFLSDPQVDRVFAILSPLFL
jgi:hypothetical protein